MTQTIKAQQETDKPPVDDASIPVPKQQKAGTRSSSLDAQMQPPVLNTTQTLPGPELKEGIPLAPHTTALSSSPPASPQDKNPSIEKSTFDAEMETTAADTKQETPAPIHPLVLQLKSQLAQQRQVLDQLEVERSQYRHDIHSLSDRLTQMNGKIQQRAEAQQQLESNYLEHLQSLRATPDDLTTIRQKLQDLKAKIRILADELIAKADPIIATNALRTFWLNLHDGIQSMGHPLPTPRLRMLTEKFMMDVLVQNMNLNVFPGLDVLDSYNDLALWLEQYDTQGFAPRLRQEIALVMCKENDNVSSPTHRHLTEAIHTNYKFLYGGLAKAYPMLPPTAVAKIQDLVEHAMALGFAMKGQEVDVAAAETREHLQVFDPALMVDEDGQTQGIVEFCVCPPFVVYGATMTTLEKGRVLCGPKV